MPACWSGRSKSYQGRRRRPLTENQTSEAARPRRECPRSGSIGVKDPQSMASPRSRLVTWSYTHLSFNGRRFWRPHPDLDRAATPALPPGGGRPLCGGWLPLLAALRAASPQAPQTTSPGAEPPEPPRSPGVREFAGWLLRLVDGRCCAVSSRFHRFGFASLNRCRYRLPRDKMARLSRGPLLAEPLWPISLMRRHAGAHGAGGAPGAVPAFSAGSWLVTGPMGAPD